MDTSYEAWKYQQRLIVSVLYLHYKSNNMTGLGEAIKREFILLNIRFSEEKERVDNIKMINANCG